MDSPIVIEELARQALAGDREALDTMIRALQPDVYGLALRMLWNREDAEDATQEILVRIVTRLSQFGFRSRLKTWAYRLAVNYILDVKKSAMERLNLSFERFADGLVEGREPVSASDTEQSLLIDEVKVGCSLAMLQCLDRPHRLAFVLGDIMEVSGPEAAEILEIDPALFRKRLQLAREAVLRFTRAHCGLVSDEASCQCNRRVSSSAAAAVTDAQPLNFARKTTSFQEARALIRQVDTARSALALYRTSEPCATTIDFAQRLVSGLDVPSSTPSDR
jgi:RNA polymerase sigma factor (sigma-70 family)